MRTFAFVLIIVLTGFLGGVAHAEVLLNRPDNVIGTVVGADSGVNPSEGMHLGANVGFYLNMGKQVTFTLTTGARSALGQGYNFWNLSINTELIYHPEDHPNFGWVALLNVVPLGATLHGGAVLGGIEFLRRSEVDALGVDFVAGKTFAGEGMAMVVLKWYFIREMTTRPRL